MEERVVAVREEAARHLNEALAAVDVSEKLNGMRHVLEMVLHREPRHMSEFLPFFLSFQMERDASLRRWLAELAEEVADKLPQHIPALAPALLALLKDNTAAVAKRALQSGHAIFRSIFLRVAAMGGTSASPADQCLADAWAAMHAFKSAAYTLALQPCNDGVRMHAIEFMKTVVLLFSPIAVTDIVRGSAANGGGAVARELDIARVAAEHRLLDMRKLMEEADSNVSSLLLLFQPPSLAGLPPAVMLVLLQSLTAIAKQRSPYYGKVVQAVLALVANKESSLEPMAASVAKALRAGLNTLRRCTSHSEAQQWKQKLVEALQSMGGADAAQTAIRHASKANRDPRVALKEESGNGVVGSNPRKRALKVENVEANSNNNNNTNNTTSSSEPAAKRARPSSVADAKAAITAANGDSDALSRLADELSPEILADIVIAFMEHLPASLPPLVAPLPPPPPPLQAATTTMAAAPPPPPPAPSSALPAPSSAAPPTASSTLPSPLPLATPAPTPTPVPQTVSKRDPRRDPRLAAKRTAEEAGLLVSGPATVVSAGPGTGTGAAGMTTATTTTVATATQVPGMPADFNILGGGGGTAVPTTQALEPVIAEGRSVRIKMEPGLVVTQEDKEGKPPLPLLQALATTVVVSAVPISGTASSSSKVAAAAPPPKAPPLPVVVLSEAAAAAMRRSAFDRILQSQEAMATTGASDLRLSLLARLSTQVDEGAIEVLLQHIRSDYANHKGHELSLQLLYRLAAAPRMTPGTDDSEAHADNQDSQMEADGVYNRVLTTLAKGLRTSLPFSNPSLQRLLCEAPLLTDAVIDELRSMCGLPPRRTTSPPPPPPKKTAAAAAGPSDAAAGAPAAAAADVMALPTNADTVTQGLTILWHLILDRPPLSSLCLGIVLECTLHEDEKYRDKACRLVANKLYGDEALVGDIEEFASESLKRVAIRQQLAQPAATKSTVVAKANTDAPQPNPAVENAKRYGALFLALCSKKQALLPKVFEVFGQSRNAGKAGLLFHVKKLVQSAGPTPELLSTIANQSAATLHLVTQVLFTLSQREAPSPQVIETVQKLYAAQKDAQLLIPILSSLEKAEVLEVLPKLVDLEPTQFRLALARILQGSMHAGPPLSPVEVLVALHGIDTTKDKEGAVPVRKVLEACSQCLHQKAVFTPQVVKTALLQLVEQTPLPVLFMRTIIDVLQAYPSLLNFCMDLLPRLITKQVWKSPKLWTGFLKCVEKYMPQSLPVILQLPSQQLEEALAKCPLVKTPLATFASQPHIISSVSRSAVALLGLLQEPGVADSAAAPHAVITS